MESILLFVMGLAWLLLGLPGLIIADMVVWNKGRTSRYRGTKAIVNGASMVAAGLFAIITAALFMLNMLTTPFFPLSVVICAAIVALGWICSLFVKGTVER